MKNGKFSPKAQQTLVRSLIAVGVLATVQPVFAETEIEGMKRELAEQKKLIERLLAAQPTQSVAQTAPAAAATTTTSFNFYGAADVNVMSVDSGFGSKTTIGTGGMTASSIGIKGQRDIGNGMKVIGEAEAGIAFDNGAVSNGAVALGTNNASPSSGGLTGGGSQIFSRQAYVGLNGDFGTLSVGRQYTGSYIAAAAFGNALGAGFLGNGATFIPAIGGMPTRVNNSVVYKTPMLNGFSGHFTYTVGNENNVATDVTAGTTKTNDSAGQGWDLLAMYRNGGLTAAASTWNVKNNSYAAVGETSLATKQGQQLAISYDFGGPRLYATVLSGEISGGNYENVTKTLSKASGWSVSGSIPFGKSTILASYAELKDNSLLNKNGNLLGLAYTYELFANTKLYTSWAKQTNDTSSSYALSNGGDLVGSVATPGFSPSGFMVGLNVKF